MMLALPPSLRLTLKLPIGPAPDLHPRPSGVPPALQLGAFPGGATFLNLGECRPSGE